MGRATWWLLLPVALGVGTLVPAGPTSAEFVVSPPPTTEPPTDEPPESPADDLGVVSGGTSSDVAVTLPLIPVPPGCTPPPIPHVVFAGTVVGRDVRSVRFRIDSVRAGGPAPYAVADQITGDELIDVRYGLDAAILTVGESYLVSALVDPDLGVLVSRVTAPIEDFGGDEVIGVSESDLDCPDLEDPIRTIRPDGTDIGPGPLDGFFAARSRLLLAVLVPLAAAFAAVFLLAMFRLGVSGVARSLSPAERGPGAR